jgi:hypothetical protein
MSPGPATTFWTPLENKPSSRLNGVLQKKRGVRSGLPDTIVIFRQPPIFVEVKSRAGIASKAQKQVREELVAAGAMWWLVRSARGADGVASLRGLFRRPWKPPLLGRGKGRSPTRTSGSRKRRMSRLIDGGSRGVGGSGGALGP